MTNPMRAPRVEKVTINVGVGEAGDHLERVMQIIEELTGRKPVKTITYKRIPDFGIRPKSIVGCKLTLRGKQAEEFLQQAFAAVENRLKESIFDETGNFSFGIKEHIDLPKAKYNPALGIIGMDVCVTLERMGYRVKKRKLKRASPGRHHRMTKKDAMEFVKDKFNISIVKPGEE